MGYFNKPISLSRSVRNSMAVQSLYFFGFSSLMHDERHANETSGLGCRKKGMEKRGSAHLSLGGFTTLWVVLFSLSFVSR